MQWPLGCYGLNCSWESGDNVIRDDHSPEELRCEAYAQWRSVGNIQQYERTLGTVLDGRRRLIGDLKANLSRAVAMARTPRTYRLATEQAQKSAVPAAAPVPLTAQKGLPPQTQAPHQHHQHVAAAPTPASTAVAPLPGSVYSSQDFDSFTFGAIPELPPS